MKRVLIGGLVHETHTFLAETTDLQAFSRLIWVQGSGLLDRCQGDVSPMGGALEVAQQRGWRVYPSVYGAAMPSGTVADEVLETWWQRFGADLDQALQEGLDGILLILHGAMAFTSFADGEGELLQRVRDRLGQRRLPIAADLDLHANFSPRMARNANIFTGYRQNPHTDARQAGERAAQLLDLAMGGARPQVVCLKPPVIYSPKGTSTAAEPVVTLEAMARQLEADHPELLEVCVLPGFAYADVPCAGVSFCATTTGDPREAEALLQPLARYALAQAQAGNPQDPPIDEVMPRAMALARGPIGLIEPSDNIGGGTPGDGTGILQALISYGATNSAVVINDPEAAAACHTASTGDRLTLPIGGKMDRFHGPTLTLPVELLRRSDGRFALENEKSHLASLVGRQVDMGPTALVRHQGIYILLTTNKTPPMDLGQLRSQGLVPEELYLIGIKAAISHKAAYDPILRESFYVDTPGLGASDLRRFPYRHLPRPMAPLDP
ncbi:MAG: M81 family metallopeptidase [Candidatus Latescibacteria bacterium]|nr:M81 family metallopeptidase [Candidatus Latescibacterota bacterium]